MVWEVEIEPIGADPERDRVGAEFALLTHGRPEDAGIVRASRGYLLIGNLTREDTARLADELLIDPLVETGRISKLSSRPSATPTTLTVLFKPGVMDPVALSVVDAAQDLGITVDAVRTFRRYYPLNGMLSFDNVALGRVLANEAIEELVSGSLDIDHLTIGREYRFQKAVIPLADLSDENLKHVSRAGQLALSLPEMKAIQHHFREQGRDPTDIELESVAQTWSEHCSHKTLKGVIDFQGQHIDNLLKETIFGATQEIRRRLGADDWCVSVFEDNAGIVRFNDQFHVCFKVETHNHPSAIEPYGGANTGLGGVIRDPLGTGLGAKPICNTDIFCFAPPDTAVELLPPGVLHPRKIMKGVVAGVRDYGNRIGIPTVNGAICFDDRYLANPLVFCGTVGLIPVNRTIKKPRAGDLIVVIGGRTGRDGIHGATFSSLELTADSEKVSGGAVQIGNAMAEKKMLDVILQARDLGLYHAITDCGAGGFSSAIGEMAEHLGGEVFLDRAPLKYDGLSYTEIWISESQERMVLAVAPETWPRLQALCSGEDVEATAIGKFKDGGRLTLFYRDQQVADLDLNFLHGGRPATVRAARFMSVAALAPTPTARWSVDESLRKILAAYNVCSKEWVIRQYDHEIQGGTTIKPLVGLHCDGPGDAAVVMPVLGCTEGLAIGCGMNPCYGDLNPYAMAASAIDEAVRNVLAVGADPTRIALLDNFCWGNTDRPEVLGSLVRAAQACRDVAVAYGTPFISGKDSLNNEYQSGDRHITIPHTLLISALGRVPDVRRCVTMDLKEPGNSLFVIGPTKNEMGGSHYHLVNGITGGTVPQPDVQLASQVFRALHEAIGKGVVRACHDVSEGGLATAVAEMAFAGGLGADLKDLDKLAPGLTEEVVLFSESTSRFVVEVMPENCSSFCESFRGLEVIYPIGRTCPEPRLRIAGFSGDWIVWAPLDELKEAWQKPLRW